MRKIKNIHHSQTGFASIVIALIMIIVLALLTVGFAELARREQQSALNKQLASQAYYAAESGVNDISNVINQAIKNPSNIPSLTTLGNASVVSSTQCLDQQHSIDPDTGNPLYPELHINKNIDLTHGVSYSCILLDLHPPSLLKTPVSPNTAWTTTFSTTGGGTLKNLTIGWSSLTGKPARTSGGFVPLASWNSPAVLQVSITPLADLTRQSLINNTYTVYLYPLCGSGNAPDVPQQAVIVNASCNGGNYSGTITNLDSLPGSTPGESYAINILDYYDDSSISMTNAQDTSGTQLDFSNAQALIDVTGIAKNVLKRIQVHEPLELPPPNPNYAAEAQNLCKRFATAPVIPASNPSGTTFDGLDPSCNLESP